MSRKIFIDGGANIGQSTKAFLDQWPESEQYWIYMFEPDSQCGTTINNAILEHDKKFGPNPKMNFIQKAIYTYDGEIDFFVKFPASEGNTLIKEKTLKESRIYNKHKVQCVDLSRWIRDNVFESDHLILKLDIEGAEYEVIPHLKETGALSLVDIFFLEIHGLKCNKSFDESMELIQTINSLNKEAFVWCADTFDFSNYEKEKYTEQKLKQEYFKWQSRGLSVTKE